MRHPLRRSATSLLVVVSLLFSQLALASYICPGMASTEQMSEMTASGMPCATMDESTPALCHQHAADASQFFEMAKVAIPTVAIVVQVLVQPSLLDAAQALALPFSDRPEVQPPPAPVFLETFRLRV